MKIDWHALQSVLSGCVVLFAPSSLARPSMFTSLGKPDPCVFVKSVAGTEKSGRSSPRTKFDSSSRLILYTDDWRIVMPRKKKHYLEVMVRQGGSLALKRPGS